MTATIFHLSRNSGSVSAQRSRDGSVRTTSYRTVLQRMWRAWRRHRSRVSIATLDDALLKDIGVTRAEAEYEANKPFWCA